MDGAREHNEPTELTDEERRLFTRLNRLARDWPDHLTLASMGGTLCVWRTDENIPYENTYDGHRDDAVLWSTTKIPNTGGDW